MAALNPVLISVIIPTLNAGSRLERLLAAVRSQECPGGIEILVIDSGSTDGTPERARRAGARLLSIPRRRFGHGRARNQAIQAAQGRLVVLTVQDALPTDDRWLLKLLAPMEDPGIAGSAGLQVCPPSAGLLARARSALWCAERQQPEVRSVAPDEFEKLVPARRLALIGFDNVVSCVRRSAWEETPFPDWDYGEDMAWARQVLLRGSRIAFVPEAQVWHCHERSWLYELRRAAIDGRARVRLVGWPSPDLEMGDALALIRRMAFFLATRRFDALVEPAAAFELLTIEMARHDPAQTAEADAGPRLGAKPAKIYHQILEFAWGLTEQAARLCPDGLFPEKAWIELFRFATVALVGQDLGVTMASRPETGSGRPLEEAAWKLLERFLCRGV